VENGLTSTTVADTANAAAIPATATSPCCRNGTASGTTTPRIAIDEAKAEATPPR